MGLPGFNEALELMRPYWEAGKDNLEAFAVPNESARNRRGSELPRAWEAGGLSPFSRSYMRRRS